MTADSPDADGIAGALSLADPASGDDILIVAITGYGQTDDRARSREAGFDYHLVKPVDVSQLLHLCSECKKPASPRATVV